ncbi:fluoride efflux transporter CrcB [Anaeromyxobacter oryzae]|uniref:Fluoride-specific ion channel FluC n=1 Tax=Anaeromyxobacter oryzae TaxID=2918170 RepID=A0ABM7WRX4_9BACT|nr:fluoride efflux transporter CrcB [Anaeromyxobacter oryzae]BDG02201.1 putative fluoride ion transporter CrcB [Anaeromyxobacter oryzae]
MDKLLLVCVGGALGSGARYLVGTWSLAAFGPGFPRGTLAINVIGSFLLAVIMTASITTESVSPHLRLFLATGVMGGFTTYSSFNWETITLAQEGRFLAAGLYLAATLLGCLAGGLAGTILVHRVVG